MPKTADFNLTKSEITKLIFLSGLKATGFRVHTGRLDGLDDIDVPSLITGHLIVRALREVALRRPDLLPASIRPADKPRRSRARSADAC
jgi:hypothetical protein